MKKRSIFALVLVLALMLCTVCSADELSEGADVRIMSYNLMHPSWSKVALAGRDTIAFEIINTYTPDVIATLETSQSWNQAFKAGLTDYANACRKSNGNQYNLTTFFYNTKTLSLVEEYVLDLDAKSDIRVVSVAVFEKLDDGARFVVANTHPSPTSDAEKYESNMAGITAYANELQTKYADLPIIFCGDYNTDERSDRYAQFLQETGLKAAKHEAEMLVRDHATYFAWGEENAEGSFIDHIFVNGKTATKLFNVIIDHQANEVSDHFPVYADIDLQ